MVTIPLKSKTNYSVYDKVDNSDRITEPSTLFHALLLKPSEQLSPDYAPRDNRHTCPTS